MKNDDTLTIFKIKPKKPKDGDAFIDETMHPPRVRRWHHKSDTWLTDDEYAYRKAKE